jgi:hypothetical protein
VSSGTHEYRQVNSRIGFPGVDHAAYDALEQLLESEGFLLLGDYEDVTLNRRFSLMRTFLRAMTSADGTITAGIYALRLVGPLSLLGLAGLLPCWTPMLDLDTELTDGTLVETGCSLWRSWMRQCPAIFRPLRKRLPPVAELLGKHIDRRRAILETRPGVQAKVVQSLAEVWAQGESHRNGQSVRDREFG